MNNDPNDSQPQLELEWLARYFYSRGFKDKAQEIMQRLQTTNNLVDIESARIIEIRDNDEERRA